MKKELLYYGFSNDRLDNLLNVAKDFGIETKEVVNEDLGQKIGTLFNLDGYEREESEKLDDIDIEFIVFSDFDRKELQGYLLALKEKGITIPHKAVITDTSKDWQFYYLVDHIKDEHEVVQLYNELGKLIKKAQKILDEKEDEELRDTVEYALSVREINGVEKTDIMPRYNKLKELLDE